MSFWGELKRRNVYKVGVAYAIVAWLLIQFAAIAFPHFAFPSWAVPFVIVILIIGFPLILLFAWAFEITPDGIKRTRQVPLEESITHLTGKKLNYILAGLLVLAISFLLFDNYYLDRRVTEPEFASIETPRVPDVGDVEKAKKTIAVLPFINRSSEKDQEYFVDGLSDEIITRLSQIPDLQVTSSTSSFTFKGSDKTIQEIAEILGREYILEGSVRKVGNDLRIAAQLIHAPDDRHLWSEIYDREFKDIFEIQEDIALAVADELKVTLGIGKSFKQLDGTDNPKAYELYLVAKGQINKGMEKLALESIDEALALDPNFALAWARKSTIHQNLVVHGLSNHAASELVASLNAVQRAIEIDPNSAEAYAVLGGYRMSIGDWIEAERAFQNALELATGKLSEFKSTIGFFYNGIGFFKKASEFFEEELQNDPLDQDSRAYYILNSAFLGNMRQAEEEYELGKKLFGEQWMYGNLFITMARLGTGHIVSRDRIVYSDPIWDAVKEHLDSPENGLAELRRLYTGDGLSSSNIIQIADWAAYFGDLEFAMDALEKGLDIQVSGIFNIWYPTMREVRQRPRFKEFVMEIGLVDYWNEFGWPDICRPLDNGDFECD